MKNIKIVLFCLLQSFIFSQIENGQGFYPIDSCSFEYLFNQVKLELDTASTSVWQIGKPQKQILNSSFSDSLAIITDTILFYPPSNHSYFDLKIPFIGFTTNVFFKHKINTDSLLDGGYIEVSYDYGLSWKNVILDSTQFIGGERSFHSENLYGIEDSLSNSQFGFSGNSDWIETRLQWVFFLPARGDIPDTLYVRFNFVSDSISSNKDGWIIDDFHINTTVFGLGVNENTNSILTIYPNPVGNNLNLKIENNITITKFMVYDLFGNLLIQDHFNVVDGIDISLLKSGLYYLEIETNNGFFKQRFNKFL